MMMGALFSPVAGLLISLFHQSGADAVRVGAVVVVPVAIGVDVQGVVEVVAVRRAEPPVGGRFESHPISSGEPRRIP